MIRQASGKKKNVRSGGTATAVHNDTLTRIFSRGTPYFIRRYVLSEGGSIVFGSMNR